MLDLIVKERDSLAVVGCVVYATRVVSQAFFALLSTLPDLSSVDKAHYREIPFYDNHYLALNISIAQSFGNLQLKPSFRTCLKHYQSLDSDRLL